MYKFILFPIFVPRNVMETIGSVIEIYFAHSCIF